MEIEIFKDRNGKLIKNGDTIKIIRNIKVGESNRERGRVKYHVNNYEDVEIIYKVNFGIYKTLWYGEIFTWYLTTEKVIEYNTGFYKDIGYTKLEKEKNRSVKTKTNLDLPLNTKLASICEIINKGL